MVHQLMALMVRVLITFRLTCSPTRHAAVAVTGNFCTPETNEGIGISIPNTNFNPVEDMITVHRHENETGLSISKFEMLSLNNAILILVEPEDDRYTTSVTQSILTICRIISRYSNTYLDWHGSMSLYLQK